MTDIKSDIEIIRNIPAVPSILEVVSKTTGMGFAAVARVTQEQWVACEVLDNIDFGLAPGGELRVETTICSEIRDHREAVVIDDVQEDAVFCSHHTPAMYGFRSYISMPIILADGSFFGTLCAIDPHPRKLTSEIVGMFRLFAELIAVHVDARSRFINSRQQLSESQAELREEQRAHAVSQVELDDARSTGDLRDQFVAVLGHDLRNPLAAINGGIQILTRQTEDPKSKTILQMMTATTQRMGALIDNILDFARGRLGGGIGLERRSVDLNPVVTSVIDEMRSAHPERVIETRIDLAKPFEADPGRIGQLLSNLLGNAITHGSENEPIRLIATSDDNGLTISVANGGEAIANEMRDKLFRPFQRGEVRPSLQGLGLGLYIASQIAQAHGGVLDVSSTDAETKFTFTAPTA